MYQHLQAGGVGYRQIIDFRQFIVTNAECLDEFLVTAETVGLRRLDEALIGLLHKYMEIEIAVETPSVKDEVVDQLMSEFMHAGNFGRKEASSADKRAATVLKQTRNPFKLLVTLQKYGRIHWKASEKHVVLRPFAWIYQIVYYIKQVRKNGGLSVIAQGRERLSNKEQLLKELGL